MALLLQQGEGLRRGLHFLACGLGFCYILDRSLVRLDNKYAYLVSLGGLMVPGSEGERLVLIVEDEPDNREIMRAVVEDILGYRAMLAADGEEALRLASEYRPRLILMDLMMPVLDGFEAIRKLKTLERTAGIPVVAVTALSRPVDLQRAVENGADEYIGKPFDLDHLAEVVERHASGWGASEAGERNAQNAQYEYRGG